MKKTEFSFRPQTQWAAIRSFITKGIAVLMAFPFVPLVDALAEKPVMLIDDFEDGSHRDGTPLRWSSGFGGGEVKLNPSSGDLVLTATVGRPSGGTNATRPYLENTSIRTQCRLKGNAESVGVYAQSPNHYERKSVVAAITPSGTLFIRHLDGMKMSESKKVRTDLRVRSEDVVLQLDIVGNEASLYGWRPGEAMPTTPQISYQLPLIRSGRAGVGFRLLSTGSQATFQYVVISSTPIRERHSDSKLREESHPLV